MYKSFAAVATLGATVSAQTVDTQSYKVTTTALPDTATTSYRSLMTTANVLTVYSVTTNSEYSMMLNAAFPTAGVASMANCMMEPGETTYLCGVL